MAPLEEKMARCGKQLNNPTESLLPEHAQTAATYQQDSGQDDEETTTSARGPGAVGSARTVVPVEILRPHSGR